MFVYIASVLTSVYYLTYGLSFLGLFILADYKLEIYESDIHDLVLALGCLVVFSGALVSFIACYKKIKWCLSVWVLTLLIASAFEIYQLSFIYDRSNKVVYFTIITLMYFLFRSILRYKTYRYKFTLHKEAKPET